MRNSHRDEGSDLASFCEKPHFLKLFKTESLTEFLSLPVLFFTLSSQFLAILRIDYG
jgi:hypothetical protein